MGAPALNLFSRDGGRGKIPRKKLEKNVRLATPTVFSYGGNKTSKTSNSNSSTNNSNSSNSSNSS